MVILFFYLVSALMTLRTHGALNFTSEKPIMCFYNGLKYSFTKPMTLSMDPLSMPNDCELIVYTAFDISTTGNITTNPDVIKKLTSFGKPVYLLVYRENRYVDWSTILKPDGNAEDAKAITDFAVANNVQGVILFTISPVYATDEADPNVGKNIIPYLRQLKVNPDFGVGIFIQAWNPNIVADPSVYNFKELNNVVDLYVTNTISSKPCNPAMDTIIPNHGPENSGYGLDSIDKTLRTTRVNNDINYFIIAMSVMLPAAQITSYGQVCRGNIDCKTWCIPTTKGFYEQAQFIKHLNYGMSTMWLEFDDIYNACGCGPFVGFQNMVAGYNGAPQIPCEKFDTKLSCPP